MPLSTTRLHEITGKIYETTHAHGIFEYPAAMRQTESDRLELCNEIQTSVKFRDGIPAVLLGLQYLRTAELLEAKASPKTRKDTGRPGLEQWQILSLAMDTASWRTGMIISCQA